MAEDKNMDLVEVSPNTDPPVCKILDFGKHMYKQKKRQGEKKKPQTQSKEIRLRPTTDEHDIDIKANQCRKFLTHGKRVQVTMQFRGREMQFVEIGKSNMIRFAESLSDVSKVEKTPVMSGKRMTMNLVPFVKAAQ